MIICDLFVHLKSYLLKNLGGNANFFAVVLRKFEPSCKIGAYFAAILGRFCIENGQCWRFVAVLCIICRYHIYKEVWNPSIGEAFMCFTKEENSHDRKAVALTCTEECVVGHLPHEITGLCFNFIKHGGEVNGEITGRRRRQHTKTACGGMEIS